MKRRQSANETIKRRAQKWHEEDPSVVLTKDVERATQHLREFAALLLSDRLIQETTEKTFWSSCDSTSNHSEILMRMGLKRFEEIKGAKLEQCDLAAQHIHDGSINAAAAQTAWESEGTIGIAKALNQLFELAFGTIKKIGLCYGYDTNNPNEELIVFKVFVAINCFQLIDKQKALSDIDHYCFLSNGSLSSVTRDTVLSEIARFSGILSAGLISRRALVPLLVAVVEQGSSANACFLNDIGWAARNVYSMRKIKEANALKAETKAKAESAKDALKPELKAA